MHPSSPILLRLILRVVSDVLCCSAARFASFITNVVVEKIMKRNWKSDNDEPTQMEFMLTHVDDVDDVELLMMC